VTTGQWHEVQIHVRLDGANPADGRVEVWYDGAPVGELSQTDNLGTAPVARLQLGENTTTKTFDMVFDDVVAGTQFIASSFSPTTTPEPTTIPASTAPPSPTAITEGTATPEVTLTPGPTTTPDLTATPDFTATPELTATSDGTATFSATATPQQTPDDTPAAIVTPSPTPAVTLVEATPSAPPQEMPAPESTPTPTLEVEAGDGGAAAAKMLADGPAASDIGHDAPERLETPEPTPVLEASGEATRGDDDPSPSGGGGQSPSTAPADPEEPDRGDGDVDAGPVLDESAVAPEEQPEHGPGEAPGAVGDTTRDGKAPVGDGATADERNDARLALEPGGNRQPEASPEQRTASTSPEPPDEDGPAQEGNTGGRKATRHNNPPRGGRAETQPEAGGTEPSSAREPAQHATPPENTRADTSVQPADDTLRTGETDALPAAGEEPTTRGEHAKPGKGTKHHPRNRGGSSNAAAETSYRIAKTRQSANAGDAAVVVDDDPTTAWHTAPGATPQEAYVELDLGKRRTIGRVRWLVAPDGLAGAVHIAVSRDGKRWTRAAGVAKDASDAWQELRLKHAVDARYVRLVFTNPTHEPRLGGLAEVEIRPAPQAGANGSESSEERNRTDLGHGKPQSGHGKAKAGNQHTANKDRNKQQDQQQDRAKSSRQRKPDQNQGQERNKGQERKKETAKSSHKRAHRGPGS
jgi:hypothetical protein